MLAQPKVDLHDANLTPRDLKGIAAMISRAKRMKSLDLSNNNLGTKGIALLVATLIGCQTSRLTELDLSETGLNDKGVSFEPATVVVCRDVNIHHPPLTSLLCRVWHQGVVSWHG